MKKSSAKYKNNLHQDPRFYFPTWFKLFFFFSFVVQLICPYFEVNNIDSSFQRYGKDENFSCKSTKRDSCVETLN